MITRTADAPADRFCDLVMKGGVTSGVVYPAAIDQLSHHYRFKNIGGTSAGAIAAAVTAAAEYRRRVDNSRAGFDLLQQLPDQLKADISPGRRKLFSLFQPQPGAQRLFRVLTQALNASGTWQRVAAIVGGLARAYWLAVVVGGALAWRVDVAAGHTAGGLTFVMTAITLVLLGVYWDLTRNLASKGFGMCTGMTEPGQPEALTPWLHHLIQSAAGRTELDKPLTFGDLWDAPGYPVPPFLVPVGERRKSINLRMFATNLGHGRPYIFPLADPDAKPSRFRGADRLFFSETELKPYLPTEVLRWMRDHGRAYAVDPGREKRDPPLEQAQTLGLVEVPLAQDFPILLAARMSLSFPLLFAAVPLWAINYDLEGQAVFRRCWFSDGGISSNFPVHLFDGLVPAWPTFGINLEPEIKGEPGDERQRDDVYLPTRYATGYGERWDNFDQAASGGARFGGFVSAIVGTMQNWNDNALARMPGVRDRIARIRLNPSQGGLNLNMEQHVIDEVATLGKKAAEELIQRFVPDDPAGPQTAGWDEQRWVRLGVLLRMVEERAAGVMAALDTQCPHATPLHDLIEQAAARGARPAGYEAELTARQKAAMHQAVAALGVLAGSTTGSHARTGFKAIPEPELRVRPPL